jgi:alkylated DNA nucleotide flippase Atl1
VLPQAAAVNPKGISEIAAIRKGKLMTVASRAQWVGANMGRGYIARVLRKEPASHELQWQWR